MNNSNAVKTDSAPRLMSIEAVAATGILSKYALRMMHKRGELPCLEIGKKTLVNYDKLIQQLNSL